MKLKIKYFGMLTEITQCTEEEIPLLKGKVQDVIRFLIHKYPLLENRDFKIAQNQIVVSNQATLTSEEIALLPPFSGG